MKKETYELFKKLTNQLRDDVRFELKTSTDAKELAEKAKTHLKNLKEAGWDK